MIHAIRRLCCILIVTVPLLTHAQDQAGAYLLDIDDLLMQAHAASQIALEATEIQEIKAQAEIIAETVWGSPSGLLTQTGGAAVHGWKTRWQTDGTEFDEAHSGRHGSDPPLVADPKELGMMGRGRAVIELLSNSENEAHVDHVMASLSNVIGWMRLSDGVTKGERQPRIDLTHVWDAPSRFWNTSADTGWLLEAYAQAINILKTDYHGNLGMAREHASAMANLLEKCRTGQDENGDGSVAPVMMEGGIDTALQHAGYLGIIDK
ncbi:MAG: hypothetical protein OXH34_07290 [Bacteroidetes bacterium]|nr:hypothetical protein [Bacteroidota bacterium]